MIITQIQKSINSNTLSLVSWLNFKHWYGKKKDIFFDSVIYIYIYLGTETYQIINDREECTLGRGEEIRSRRGIKIFIKRTNHFISFLRIGWLLLFVVCCDMISVFKVRKRRKKKSIVCIYNSIFDLIRYELTNLTSSMRKRQREIYIYNSKIQKTTTLSPSPPRQKKRSCF